MANIDVKNTRGQTSESGAMQTTGRGGLARRGTFFPSLFSLSPIDLWNTSPFELMRRFTEEMDRWFEDFGVPAWGARGAEEAAVWAPPVEVFERGGNLVVRADLPGLNKEDIKVEVTDDGLVIQGERKREHEEKGEGYYRSERSYGRFYRLIPLPDDINLDQVRAQFNNGVLEITAPVPESSKRRREIPINVESGSQTQAATT
jgi:HSP20 family protein